jgi:hypothetical protein
MKKISHSIYYLIELVVLVAGFFVTYLLSFNFKLQEVMLAIVLVFYTLIGIVHHSSHHTLKRKIVIEYVLISILIFAVFIFLNTSKI